MWDSRYFQECYILSVGLNLKYTVLTDREPSSEVANLKIKQNIYIYFEMKIHKSIYLYQSFLILIVVLTVQVNTPAFHL